MSPAHSLRERVEEIYKSFRRFGCLWWFASVFAVTGTLGLWKARQEYRSRNEARHWTETPMTILSARQESYWSGGRGSREYRRIVAIYEYQFGGKRFSSNRVGLLPGDSENSESAESPQLRFRILQEHLARGIPFSGFVDPNNPEQAILFRDFATNRQTFLATISVAFCLFGGGLLAGLHWCRSLTTKALRQAEIVPHEPWKWFDMRSDGVIAPIPLWLPHLFVAGIGIFISCAFGVLMIDRLHRDASARNAVFMVAGVAVLASLIAIWSVYRQYRFGSPRLRTDWPLRMGQQYRCEFFSQDVPEGATLQAELKIGMTKLPLVLVQTDGAGRWNFELELPSGHLPSPFPYELTNNSTSQWVLTIHDPSQGGRFKAEYELNVFE